MKNFWVQLQEEIFLTVAQSDTLTESYSQQWEGAAGMENASPLIQTAASYDLIFIVLGVSLIIWFILLFFIIRLDNKVSKLEDQVTQEHTD